MTLDRINSTLLMEIFQLLNQQNGDATRTILEIIYNEVMLLERQQTLRADPHERTADRKGYANGYKNKTLNTRMGSLELKVPQTRDVPFYPTCLEKGSRSEKALKVAIAEMYLKGVSTRKVTAITKELCGLEISSTQVSSLTKELDEEFESFRSRSLGIYPYVFVDAIYLKIRHNGSVISQAILIAYGINESGQREILGISTSLSEAEVHWRSFLESLQQRGLSGIRLITSDSHSGLRQALTAVFPSVPWQRCQFHLAQNAQHHAPKKSMQPEITKAVSNIFSSPTKAAAAEAKRQVINQFSKKAPEFAVWLENNIDEGLACLSFPEEHQKKIRTTNGLERVNREIKRRTRVATLFPNGDSALRLVTGVLIEIHEEWATSQKTYLNMKPLFEKEDWKE